MVRFKACTVYSTQTRITPAETLTTEPLASRRIYPNRNPSQPVNNDYKQLARRQKGLHRLEAEHSLQLRRCGMGSSGAIIDREVYSSFIAQRPLRFCSSSQILFSPDECRHYTCCEGPTSHSLGRDDVIERSRWV